MISVHILLPRERRFEDFLGRYRSIVNHLSDYHWIERGGLLVFAGIPIAGLVHHAAGWTRWTLTRERLREIFDA